MADWNFRVRPPVDGSVNILGVIDFNHERNFAHPFFIWSNNNIGAEPHVISQGEFARASHRVAHIVRPRGQSVNQEVVAIIASIDTILYIALISGIIRAGLVVSCFIYIAVERPLDLSFVCSALSYLAEEFACSDYFIAVLVWVPSCPRITTRRLRSDCWC